MKYFILFCRDASKKGPNSVYEHTARLIEFFHGMIEFDAEEMAKEEALLIEWEWLHSTFKANIQRY